MIGVRRPSSPLVALAAALGLLAAGAVPLPAPARAEEAAAPDAALQPLAVETASGRHVFKIELARTPQERARGLMYRKSLAPDRGMLFDMEVTAPAAFWMANTFVSLDIVFIGADGRVLNVAADTVPLSRETVASDGDARFVLELLAGQGAAIGLKPGDRVVHPLIDAAART